MKPDAIILCGGKETRFGRSKATAVVAGETVIDRVTKVLALVSDHVIAVTSPEKRDISLGSDTCVVVDEFPHKGPLGGIYTGLLHARSEFSIVVGCDMPFLNASVLSHLVGLSPGFDAVIPRMRSDMIEPLHAVYSKSCMPAMKAALEADQLSIWHVVKGLHVRFVEKEEYLPLDPLMVSFFNINYPADLDRANRISEQLEGLRK